MYEGWMIIGHQDPVGNPGEFAEIVNNPRAYAYATWAGLCWLEDCGACDAASIIAPGFPYISPIADPAPWYDANDPDSWGFLGVIGLDVVGDDSSTRQAEVKMSLNGTGIIGPTYMGPRTMVVRALAIATDDCSLQFGLAWLRKQYGTAFDACAGDTLTFYDCCPCVCDDTASNLDCWPITYKELKESPPCIGIVGPAQPAYVNASIGTVSTADTADLVIDGDVRFLGKVLLEGGIGTNRTIAGQRGASSQLSWSAIVNGTDQYAMRKSANGSTIDTGASPSDQGQYPGSDDRIYRTDWRMSPPAGELGRTHYVSSAGAPWQFLGSYGATPGVPWDSTNAIVVGAHSGPSYQWQGRIYSAEMQRINRAQLVFPGLPGNHLETPDAPEFNITGDIEFVFRSAATAWSANGTRRWISKDDGVQPRGWVIGITSDGRINYNVGSPSGVFIGGSSTGLPIAAAGAMQWIKITHNRTTGLVSFFYAADQPGEPTVWTACGTVTGTTGAAINNVISPLAIGGRPSTPVEAWDGRISRVIVRSGIAGTTVLDVSENDAGLMTTPTTFTCRTGQVFTVLGTGSEQNFYMGSGSTITTPDTPDLAITGPIRLTYRARIDGMIGTSFPPIISKQSGTPGRELMAYFAPQASNYATAFSVTDTTLAAIPTIDIIRPTPFGEEHVYGMEAAPWSRAATAIVDDTRTARTASSAFAFPDTTNPLQIGPGNVFLPGRMYWAQVEEIKRAQLQFNGATKRMLSVPYFAWPANMEILARVSLEDPEATASQYPTIIGRRPSDYDLMFRLLSGSKRTIAIHYRDAANAAFNFSGSWPASAIAPNQLVWFRARLTTTEKLLDYSLADTDAPPTTWTSLHTSARATPGVQSTSAPVTVGVTDVSPYPWPPGRIARVIVTNLDTSARVLDLHENDTWPARDGGETPGSFVARSGQTVTVTGSTTPIVPQQDRIQWRFDAADYPGTGTVFTDPRGRVWTMSIAGSIVPSVGAIVKPQPDSTMWRFDATEYPGTGLSYVDPRGRTWTLSTAGAISPVTPPVFEDWWPPSYGDLIEGPPPGEDERWCNWVEIYRELITGPPQWTCCVDACVTPYLRQFYNVRVTRGPMVLNQPKLNSKGAVAEIEFTVISGDPVLHAMTTRAAMARVPGTNLITDVPRPTSRPSPYPTIRQEIADRIVPVRSWSRDVIPLAMPQDQVLTDFIPVVRVRAREQTGAVRLGLWAGEERIGGYTIPYIAPNTSVVVDGARAYARLGDRYEPLSGFVQGWEDQWPKSVGHLPFGGGYTLTVDQDPDQAVQLTVDAFVTPVAAG